MRRPTHRLNVVIILTDDQSFDTLPSEPPAMPWLQSQIQDPNGNWLWFPNAFLNTPLCCPSRASILTGLYSHHTGVMNNGEGDRLDESNTLATWLHGAGYTTALIGKYLNRYPFGRGPYVPPGWDRWVVKRNIAESTTYYGYGIVDQGVPLVQGDAPSSYATTYLATQAVDFLRVAPTDRPYFLYFAPSAPHPPWIPAPRDVGVFRNLPLGTPASVTASVRGKPRWVRQLPAIGPDKVLLFMGERRRERETLLGADAAAHQIVDAIRARGDLGRTVIFFLTDNGYSFGQHRIAGKRCAYEECIRTPFAVRVPGLQAHDVPGLVSNVDLAPTIADLVGVKPGLPTDGRSFADALRGKAWPGPKAVLCEWGGDPEVPPWWEVRTRDYAYIEDADGTTELYDLTGRRGSPDRHELYNRARDPRYQGVVKRLAKALDRLRSAREGGG